LRGIGEPDEKVISVFKGIEAERLPVSHNAGEIAHIDIKTPRL